jgi:hypothetical protein
MRSRRGTASLLAAILVSAAGCEARNPEAISRQRHPELYAGGAAAAVTRAPAITDLPDGDEVLASDGGKRGDRINLSSERAGWVTVDVNDPVFVSRLDPLFDGDITTLSRTEGVNPLVMTFHFPTPVRLSAVRLFPSYSSYDWSVELKSGTRAMIVRKAAPDTWSTIVLQDDVETDTVRVTLRRLERDDYVHLNEVELWTSSPR